MAEGDGLLGGGCRTALGYANELTQHETLLDDDDFLEDRDDEHIAFFRHLRRVAFYDGVDRYVLDDHLLVDERCLDGLVVYLDPCAHTHASTSDVMCFDLELFRNDGDDDGRRRLRHPPAQPSPSMYAP